MTTIHAPAAPQHTGPSESGHRLTFTGHIEELRRRLAVSLVALLVAIGGSLTQVGRIISWLQRPAQHLLPRFAFFTPTEPIIAYIKVSVLAGLILAMPVMLSQLWAFVRSGLTPRERSFGLAFILWGSFLFIAGAAFAYYTLLPASLQILLGIGRSYLEPVISIDSYLSFVTTLLFWCGVIFELPLIVFVLAKVGVVTSEWLRQQRPYAVLILAIIAAIVTPTTDPVNMLLLTAPMVLLYELSIWITRAALRPH